MNKRNILLIGLVVVVLITGIFLFGSFYRSQKEAYYYHRQTQNLISALKQKEKEYSNDIYSGDTPEETYRAFLQALQKKDIETAVKYFISDKQEDYKQLFSLILQQKKWEDMMSDLLKKENQSGDYKDKNTYVIHVLNDDKVLVAQPVLKKIEFSFGKTKKQAGIWKITEF